MSNKNKKTLAMIIVSTIMVILLGVGVWAYNTPYSYVSLDVNPSFEFTVNIFNRVIQVNAVNDDASEIINEIGTTDFCNKDITDAVSNALYVMVEKGYLTEKEGGVVIATSKENLAKRLNAAINSLLENELNEDEKPILVTPEPTTEEPSIEPEETPAVTEETPVVTEENPESTATPAPTTEPTDIPVEPTNTPAVGDDDDSDVHIIIICIGKERVKRARALGITPGKLNIIEKLQKAMNDDNFDIDEWIDKPVKVIMNKIKELHKEEYSNDEPSTEEPSTNEPDTGEPSTDKQNTKDKICEDIRKNDKNLEKNKNNKGKGNKR